MQRLYQLLEHGAGHEQRIAFFIYAIIRDATANKQKYITHATLAASVFKEHGAMKVVECWGDDVPEGKLTSFPMAVKRKDDETVVFSWIVWPTRAARDQAWEKVMADPRLSPETNPMPFDGKLLIYGGFNMILEA